MLDYYLGIPLIFLLSLFNPKRKPPKNFDRIGVLITAALGDTTLLTAFLQDIKAAYPTSSLILFVGESNAPLLPHLPSLTEGVLLPIKSPFKALKILRHYPLDLLIDAGAWPRFNSLLTLLSKAKWTIGFKTLGQGRHFGYDVAILHRRDLHEMDNYKSLLPIPSIHSPQLLLTTSYPLPHPFVVFHLFATSYQPEEREWPFAYWKELLKEISCDIYLTGSTQDKLKNESFLNFCGNPKNLHNLAGQTSLAESLSVLSQATYVVSINTGVMHMAAALGTPVIALNGPAPASRWGAVGPRSINLSPTTEGGGFLHLGFEFKGQKKGVMNELLPSQVFAVLKAL